MRAFVLGLVLAASPAAAQAPLTLFGIPFNEPLNLPECPWRETRDYMSRDRKATKREYTNTTFSDSLCFTQYPNIGQPLADGTVSFIFPLREQPSMGRLGGRVVDGKLQRLNIHTRGIGSQTLDFQALTEKFGQPTTLNRPTVQNRMGADFETIEAEWKLDDGTTITYGSALTKIDEGIVIISTPDGDAAQRVADEEYRRKWGGRQL